MRALRTPAWLAVLPLAVQGVRCSRCNQPGSRWGRARTPTEMDPLCSLCVLYAEEPPDPAVEALVAAVETRLGPQPRDAQGRITLALADRLVGAVALTTRLEARARG